MKWHQPWGEGLEEIDFKIVNLFKPYLYIKSFLDLEDDWDSYGAKKFTAEQVDRAVTVYNVIYNYYVSKQVDFEKNRVFVAPGSDNSICFIWSGAKFPTRELEVHCPSVVSNDLEYVREEYDGNFEEEATLELGELPIFLDWLFHIKTNNEHDD